MAVLKNIKLSTTYNEVHDITQLRFLLILLPLLHLLF